MGFLLYFILLEVQTFEVLFEILNNFTFIIFFICNDYNQSKYNMPFDFILLLQKNRIFQLQLN